MGKIFGCDDIVWYLYCSPAQSLNGRPILHLSLLSTLPTLQHHKSLGFMCALAPDWSNYQDVPPTSYTHTATHTPALTVCQCGHPELFKLPNYKADY